MAFLDFLFGGNKVKSGVAAKPGKPKKVKANTAAISRWELRGRTGQGSMSKVYQAYDKTLGRSVCLKLLDKEKTRKFEERFKGLKKPSEGEVCMILAHKNLLKTYEFGTITGTGEPYVVMEWVEGVGLNYLVETKNKQLDGHRINYLAQLADALQFMHDSQYLHRDLCPRNVMVDKEGTLKLIDFGLTIPYTPAFCVPGNRTGTPDYLAPELVNRKRTDHRVDLYALGVTAFEMFTFALPWERTASSEENFRRRLNSPPRNPMELNPKVVDEAVTKLLMKSFAREPADRFDTARSFKKALEALPRQDY